MEPGLVAATAARFDHVAHAVPRIRDVLPLYAGVMGARFVAGGDNPRVGYRGLQLELELGGKIELLEPLPGSDFFTRFFARHPGGGLHHLTFMVPDIHAAAAAAAAAGYEVTGAFFENPVWQEVFLHPRSTAGVLIQFVQTSADHVQDGSGSTIDAVLDAPVPA
jgi:methylmalonyl-CoA/ethylmalonyl-CoA epimerase